MGDACFDAQAFREALDYYAKSGDADRLKKLARVLFVRKHYSGAADEYSRAGNEAGLLAVADAYAEAERPALAAYWVRMAGDAGKAAAYTKALKAPAVRVRLEATHASDVPIEEDMSMVWWHDVVIPFAAEPDESNSRRRSACPSRRADSWWWGTRRARSIMR